MNIFKNIDIEIDYERPTFDFPTSTESGNPMVFFKLACERLSELGYRKESEELDALKFQKFENAHKNIFRFLDFSIDESATETEDDEYIYIKKKKNKAKQLNEFKNLNVTKIKELEANNFDFSTVNNYNRNIAFYINDVETMKYFLEKNKINNWISAIDLDVFNSSILHNRKNIELFNVIFSYIEEEEPKEVAKLLLIGENKFNINAFYYFLKELGETFSKPLNEKSMNDTINTLLILKNVYNEKFNELVTNINRIENTAQKNLNSQELIIQKNLQDVKFNLVLLNKSIEDSIDREDIKKGHNIKVKI